MTAALEAGGVTIGILADNLLKKSVERNARHAIADGRLMLLSPYHPNARFTVGTAMGRNKLIYAMADYGLVVSAEHKKGGTWAGAEEELKREISRPVFVRIGNYAPDGNNKLLGLGAIAWAQSIDRMSFKQQLFDLAAQTRETRKEKNPSLFDFQKMQATHEVEKEKQQGMDEPAPKPSYSEDQSTLNRADGSVYEAVLPVILRKLKSPETVEELSESLDVNKTQLNAWLKKAVDENKIIKLPKPVRYQKAESGMQI